MKPPSISFGGFEIVKDRYLSSRNLHEFDAVFLSFKGIAAEVTGETDYQKNQGILGIARFSLNRVHQFVKDGGLVFITYTSPRHLIWDNSDRQALEKIFSSHEMPLKSTPSNGTTVEGRGEAFIEFASALAGHLQYTYIFSKESTPQGLVAPGPGHPLVGFRLHDNNAGQFVLVPDLTSWNREEIIAQYCAALLRLGNELRLVRDQVVSEQPAWSSLVLLPGEKSILDEIAVIRTDISSLNVKAQKAEQDLELLRDRKYLFTGSGDALETQVAWAFQTLGFEVSPGPEGHADLVISKGEFLAVVEVKGLTGSANERNIGQLLKWQGEYLSDHGKAAKGILLVNAYRDVPLAERLNPEHSPAFPDGVSKIAAKNQQALITGIQLLNMALAAKDNLKSGEEISESIERATGCMDGFTYLPSPDAAIEVG